ncbi:hypothetical protein WICPIJ_006185 [Wickerhamomyces pijperi]|uniref:Uncharacterized protein n=1 Tax=Wickerhamomyces pijperi TaxID=599730 RepID=A0A9P8TL42_WICPI|nr:hypothetical protein WICPIJ_006185 [Wickerhamomyces pijperi]
MILSKTFCKVPSVCKVFNLEANNILDLFKPKTTSGTLANSGSSFNEFNSSSVGDLSSNVFKPVCTNPTACSTERTSDRPNLVFSILEASVLRRLESMESLSDSDSRCARLDIIL